MQPARRKKQLVTKSITVPGNIERACEDFNAGRFYEAHEWLEEVWQMERGPARDCYKGLIQVAAAFVHLSRGKYAGAERLLRTALGYLRPYRAEGALGFDIEAIAAAAEDMYARLLAAGPEGAGRLDLSRRPRFAFDAAVLARQAAADGLWGFDAAGRAIAMEITVAQ